MFQAPGLDLSLGSIKMLSFYALRLEFVLSEFDLMTLAAQGSPILVAFIESCIAAIKHLQFIVTDLHPFLNFSQDIVSVEQLLLS